MIRNPIYGKVKLMFQTTNQINIKKPSGSQTWPAGIVIHGLLWTSMTWWHSAQLNRVLWISHLWWHLLGCPSIPFNLAWYIYIHIYIYISIQDLWNIHEISAMNHTVIARKKIQDLHNKHQRKEVSKLAVCYDSTPGNTETQSIANQPETMMFHLV